MTQVEAERTAVAEAMPPRLSWGAIVAGWLVAVGIAFLLYSGGLALGFSAFDPYNAAATAKGIGAATAVWLILTWVVSLLLGGMFASWFDGRDDATMGALHGVTVWGLSIAASGLLLALGMGGAMGSGASLVGSAAGGGMPRHAMSHDGAHGQDSRGTGSGASTLLQAQVMQQIAQRDSTAAPDNGAAAGNDMDGHPAGHRLDPHTTAAVTAALLTDHPDTAKAWLAASTHLSPVDIDGTVQGLAPQVSQAKANIKAAADQVAHYTATAMWVLFASVLLSLLAAASGGCLGASHVHRVYHTRRYARSTPAR
jgi:hypothetical protein